MQEQDCGSFGSEHILFCYSVAPAELSHHPGSGGAPSKRKGGREKILDNSFD